MIFEHEIPAGSRLYFAESAKEKRRIERVASELLEKEGFEEIATPLFSYHQHQGVRDRMELLRFSDPQNREVTLRADSTIDVVRLVTKRLGRSTRQKKWFYIQPVYRYPTLEINQIGAEWLDGRLADVLDVTMSLFEALEVDPILQISNIQIPVIISFEFDIPLEWFASMQLEKLLGTQYAWLGDLARVQHLEQLDAVMPRVPEILRPELEKMKELMEACRCKQCVLAPLYYAKMRYYDGLFFQCFTGNSPLASGGHFINDDISAAGFALYTDALIEVRTKGNEQ
ncbi:ATP phosphoribosyltransferase regulatory subunit [Hydrogenimonas urashimensis]|uniref:ATP phosphoribosyltransferase regulatory subunit n=1 Tax=Hydrogenimonas urashimensis TaxID=2740515 RepID=UPI001915A724|nr:ATP phosphoribosyltransferase regulatory subunit [Hydrogenimonas urashimensis]